MLVEEKVFSEDFVDGWMFSVLVRGWINAEGAQMMIEALAEQEDRSFGSRHGTRHCRNQGCLGPMCAKAARDYTRSTRPPGRTRTNKRHKYARFDGLLERVQELYDRDWFAEHEKVSA